MRGGPYTAFPAVSALPPPLTVASSARAPRLRWARFVAGRPRFFMRLLVVHTWLRGNLGDVLQASVLLRGLRELGPSVLDLGGYPARPGAGARELVALADHHVPEPFAWHLHLAPAALNTRLFEPAWRKRRAALFSRYDAIVSAPGPFLAEYDARWHAALEDLDVAVELGMPFILSSHSIGPLPDAALARLRRATVCVAREGATHDYLAAHGV